MYAQYTWRRLNVCGLAVLATLLHTTCCADHCMLQCPKAVVLVCLVDWAICALICMPLEATHLFTFVRADLQGLVLRLLTYLGLKYCNQRSKHNPVARAFTRMWMRARFDSKLHWWSTSSTPRSASSLPVQELSHALDHQHQKDLPAKSDIATPLLAQAVPF